MGPGYVVGYVVRGSCYTRHSETNITEDEEWLIMHVVSLWCLIAVRVRLLDGFEILVQRRTYDHANDYNQTARIDSALERLIEANVRQRHSG